MNRLATRPLEDTGVLGVDPVGATRCWYALALLACALSRLLNLECNVCDFAVMLARPLAFVTEPSQATLLGLLEDTIVLGINPVCAATLARLASFLQSNVRNLTINTT